MFRTHVSVKAIGRLSGFIQMDPDFTAWRKLAGLQRLTGKVRWKSNTRPAPVLTAAPVRALVDEQVSIRGHFLPLHCPVTLHARMHSDEGDLWESFAHYNADERGTFSLTRDPSVGGSYLGCEPMGLFWSMQPAPGGREGLRLRKKSVESPYTVHVSLLEGHVSTSEGQRSELAAVTIERWYIAPGVKRIEINQNGLVGTLFIPPGPGPFPAMLDLWGMGGGLQEYRSSLLASKGYVSFSLAYFGHKDLPGPPNCINVGDSYFKAAFLLLQDHPQVVSDRVGIIGLSFGCYLTLRIPTKTGVKPSCLVGINGPVGCTVSLLNSDGRTKNFDSSQEFWNFDDEGCVIFKDASLPANIPPDNFLKVEKLDCPLMYIVGEDDLSTASIENADLIEERLRSAGKSHLLTRLSYPGAGHLIEPPYSPSARTSMWSVKPKKLITMWGGHPALHAAAQEDAWKKILDYLEKNLRS
ncbi:bile acid-CoA:amino acid N-acyltransferase-like [Poecilia formosa]|uniref:Bile acid-CoA:amino acid N-acyltransferase-like n=1 Tax=Poecilia formosa TaxID=48698 RepID=A0A096LTS7_POEFO|nr:PREDICTED: bile acid-CoA:amino acid N-acyltransferase-like [Poecilia formosa]XP_016531476.1 PREDICTED: bile acid-CoA:amino acid N-acyltransferase-like [Poecilia formosa]XP_016531477.1 PREDICTED: bile acid-CoA:amino acid N-acyltransferase-like [Poecilia formosa]XP_016531478.1 PREDICTED: bile acid-CoA:amino acid N-acyltransferase-like [Poecilia formosa]XP_016531480.1 PREDICTED: bile acid-CoA:amino acid N-acyltransferase-like [Poecilia formosa]